MSDDVVTVQRVIPAAPAEIFELLADPSRHKEFDGSGTVVDAKGGSQRLALGSTFGMRMKMGVPYSMESTVVELEEGQRIAWQTRGPGAVGKHFGGRIWRYELEPTDGGTLVKETWDITEESALTKPVVRRASKKTAQNMAATLDRLAERFA
jgi:uncharacterized protein YndB with AHSA1/START domain